MLNDSRWIEDWNGDKAQQEFDLTVDWLKDVVQEDDIIVTHHSPSFKGVVEKWKTSNLNDCFHSDLEDFILERKPALWCHGHIHDPVDYMIGKTRVVANPYGYKFERKELDDSHGPYELKVICV